MKWTFLFDSRALNNYLIITKDAGLGPDGLKTKLENIQKGLKYLKHLKPKLRSKCRRAIEEYSEWIKPLGKQKRILRMKNSWREELCGLKLTTHDLDTAVSEETIKQFTKAMKKAMSNIELNPKEYRIIVDTIISVIITQESAVRPGAFQFMKVEEVNNPVTHVSPTDGIIHNIVFVMDHKTFGSHGPIAVPFPENTWVQLHNYLKYVRPQTDPKPPHKQLVFLNANGKMIKQPGKAVSKVTKKHQKHFTPTKIRHCIATAGNDELTDAERRAVAKGIGHTMEVHDKVYTDITIKNAKASIEAQKKLHDKRKNKSL